MQEIRLATYEELQQELQTRADAETETIEAVTDTIEALTERVRILEGASGWVG